MFSGMKMGEYKKSGLSDISGIRLVTKDIVLGSPGTCFMHMRVNWYESRNNKVNKDFILKVALEIKVAQVLLEIVKNSFIYYFIEKSSNCCSLFWAALLRFLKWESDYKRWG